MTDPSQIYTVRQRRGARRRVLPSCTDQLPGASFEVNVMRFSSLSLPPSLSPSPANVSDEWTLERALGSPMSEIDRTVKSHVDPSFPPPLYNNQPWIREKSSISNYPFSSKSLIYIYIHAHIV